MNMKNMLVLLTTMLICFASFGQEEKDSKTVEFASEDGRLLTIEHFKMPFVPGIKECKTLIITDVVTNEKSGAFVITVTESNLHADPNYSCTLDKGEIKACIQSLNYITNDLLSTKPTEYYEVKYKTNSHAEIGAYYQYNKWNAYIQANTDMADSRITINPKNLKDLATDLQLALNLINEKTTQVKEIETIGL